MKITKAEIYHVCLPMKVSFTTGFGTLSSRDAIIIRLETTDGIIGFGEAPALAAPIYNPETSITCIHIIKDFLLPKILNREISIEEYVQDTSGLKGNKIAKHGVECALWDIKSQQSNLPLWKLLQGVRTEIPVGESIGIQTSIKKTLMIIEDKILTGYQRIKIKIKPGWDLSLIQSIRKKYPNLPLMVDANSSYRLQDIDLFRKLDEYRLMMIEQPLADDDIIDHAKIQSQIKTPICLDESITSSEDARKAIEIGACKIINVKPARVGGLIESMKINQLAKRYKIPLWCGGMIETGVAKPYNLAVASLSEFSLPADMSPSSDFFKEDLTTSSIVLKNNGMISISGKVGLGYTINKNNLKRYSLNTLKIC